MGASRIFTTLGVSAADFVIRRTRAPRIRIAAMVWQ